MGSRIKIVGNRIYSTEYNIAMDLYDGYAIIEYNNKFVMRVNGYRASSAFSTFVDFLHNYGEWE
jgi:hypothetical protein